LKQKLELFISFVKIVRHGRSSPLAMAKKNEDACMAYICSNTDLLKLPPPNVDTVGNGFQVQTRTPMIHKFHYTVHGVNRDLIVIFLQIHRRQVHHFNEHAMDHISERFSRLLFRLNPDSVWVSTRTRVISSNVKVGLLLNKAELPPGKASTLGKRPGAPKDNTLASGQYGGKLGCLSVGTNKYSQILLALTLFLGDSSPSCGAHEEW
jgi:hypothetical protein